MNIEVNLHEELKNILQEIIPFINLAYDKGFQDGKLSVSKASDQYVAEQCDKAMQMGIEIGRDEAWECARKIVKNYHCTLDNNPTPYEHLFGEYLTVNTFDIPPQEAIAKIKKYEEKQNPKVKVGDELECAGKHLVVTWINDENRWNGMLLYGGDTGEERGQVISCMKGFETWKPTGKHISLVELKEESN